MKKVIWLPIVFTIVCFCQAGNILASEYNYNDLTEIFSNKILLADFPHKTDSIPYEEPQFAGGMGTEDDPWLIETAQHLNNVRNYLGPGSGRYFKQIADIDLGTPPWNLDEGWLPIGYHSTGSFRSTYDGDGHIISGLYINRPMDWNLGLFGEAWGAEIKNLGIIDADITGRYSIGALVGENYFNSTISNCYSTGNVTGNGDYTGGLVGANDNSSVITHSYSTCNVISTGNYVGGVVGSNSRGSLISYCHSKGNVMGDNYVGGLTGFNRSSVINCYSTGKITGGEYYAGGLVGGNRGLKITGSYSTGDVSGNYFVGGLTGQNWKSSVTNCYSTGNVTGYLKVGGLVGINKDATVTNSYSTGFVIGTDDYQGYYVGGLVGDNAGGHVVQGFWDIITSGTTRSDSGVGLCTWEMTFQELYCNWDFTETWEIAENKTYPFLKWQIEPGEFNHPPKFHLTLKSYIENGGIVSGDGEYFPCEPVHISAIAHERFQFVNWTNEEDEEISTNTEFVYAMHGTDITLTANFLPLNVVKGNGKEQIKVFPNPAHDLIQIQSDYHLKMVRLTNNTGQVVQIFYPNDFDLDINVSDLIPGIYILQIHSDATIVNQKIYVLGLQ